MNELIITQPNDLHLHLRDGDYMPSVVNYTSDIFGRAIIMPNLKPPVATVELAGKYYDEIRKAANNRQFDPLMTLYLTENTPVSEIHKAAEDPRIHAVKFFQAGVTTNADDGVSDIKNCYPVLEAMQKAGLPLLIHGEVTHPEVDIFDRSKTFLDEVMVGLIRDFPELKMVLEHSTTKDEVDFIMAQSEYVAATITAHHLWISRTDIFSAGINPYHYCLPIVKTEADKKALRKAATSGNPKFFLGTDSAPHTRTAKEKAGGAAGIFTAYSAMPLYAEVFEEEKALDKLENFASKFGAEFYGLPVNEKKIRLFKEEWQLPEDLPYGKDERIVPFKSRQTLKWKVALL